MRCHVLPFRADSAAANMAIDNGLLTLAGKSPGLFLRAYGWTEPAITFGYSQRCLEVEAIARASTPAGEALPRLVRRTTGGGIVDHRHDLTYAVALSAPLESARASPRQFYCQLHRAVMEALRAHGTVSILAPCPPQDGTTKGLATACFARPEVSDLILPGSTTKVAGAALRRTPEGLLAQGSIDRRTLARQPDPQTFARALAEALIEELALAATPVEVPFPEQLPSAEQRELFASANWNARR